MCFELLAQNWNNEQAYPTFTHFYFKQKLLEQIVKKYQLDGKVKDSISLLTLLSKK